ncbi:MAG: type II secretion system protein [bacterium]
MKKGFTLVEVAVVMAIIAVLSLLIIGAITLVRNASAETRHRANATSVQISYEWAYSRERSYPHTSGNESFNAPGIGDSITPSPECDGKDIVISGLSRSVDGGGCVLFLDQMALLYM